VSELAFFHIKIYTALRHRTYNQTIKVSACEDIDRYMYIHLNLYQALVLYDTPELKVYPEFL